MMSDNLFAVVQLHKWVVFDALMVACWGVSCCLSVQMHNSDADDCLFAVMTAQEAGAIWGLSRNAVSDACRRGALRARRSGNTWLVTVEAMLRYQRGRYWPDLIPLEMQPALERAVVLFHNEPN